MLCRNKSDGDEEDDDEDQYDFADSYADNDKSYDDTFDDQATEPEVMADDKTGDDMDEAQQVRVHI